MSEKAVRGTQSVSSQFLAAHPQFPQKGLSIQATQRKEDAQTAEYEIVMMGSLNVFLINIIRLYNLPYERPPENVFATEIIGRTDP
jgi:hypothetical protein